MITVLKAPGLLTVQDLGRRGLLDAGVTLSGALDRQAVEVGNLLVGNSPAAAALEWCLGGGAIGFVHATSFALTGAVAEARLNGSQVEPWVVYQATAGAELVVDRLVRGSVLYVCLGGGINVHPVLGSRSTLLGAGFGGYDGKAIPSGTPLPIAPSNGPPPAPGSSVPEDLRTPIDESPIPLAPGPRPEALGPAGWADFWDTTFTVSRAVSRVGYRLEGRALPVRLMADLPSEVACSGAVQLPPEGQPIVLMADHPTIGGYPIIGVVPVPELGRIAQRGPGDPVRFTPVSLEEAIELRRRQRHRIAEFARSRSA